MKTLLNGVNEVLKKTDLLDSDVGALTSLTDSARQTFIDSAIQAINESMDILYSTADISKPKQLKESTITLVTDIKEYGLHSCLILLRREYHLIDETNNHIITIMDENGYWQTVFGDLDQDDTGLPSYCAISPITARLVMDRTPTAAENGKVYKYRFDQDLELIDKDDEFPFNNAVFRALIPAAAELFKVQHHQEFLKPIYDASMARAARYLRGVSPRTSWAPRQGSVSSTDPMTNDEAF